MRKSIFQGLRYTVVGLVSNAVLYLLYIGITLKGVEPKKAMSLLYLIGMVQTFAFNRNWTFSATGIRRRQFIRYVISYCIGYFINIGVLVVLVDSMRMPHEWVQGGMIIVLAVVLFLLQKFWVFSTL